MSKGSGLDPVALVAIRMEGLGLDCEVIDPAATRADLTDRIAQSATLDGLLSPSSGLDPTAFDPSWPTGDGAGDDPRA